VGSCSGVVEDGEGNKVITFVKMEGRNWGWGKGEKEIKSGWGFARVREKSQKGAGHVVGSDKRGKMRKKVTLAPKSINCGNGE